MSNLPDMSSAGINRATLSALVMQRSVLRYTPAGVAVMTLGLEHQSQIVQASGTRHVAFSLEATALEAAALATQALIIGESYTFEGFWALAHYRTQRLAFHILAVLA
jgi:primosomal replication protein N